ncbi:MAG: hypothetical protein LOD88_11010, partial [Novibacillus thermophilus]
GLVPPRRDSRPSLLSPLSFKRLQFNMDSIKRDSSYRQPNVKNGLSQAFMGKLFSELNDLKISDLLEAF